MLLWHDSLEYRSEYLTGAYSGVSGVSAGLAHRKPGRSSCGGSAGQFSITEISPTGTTCIFGCAAILDAGAPPTDYFPFLEFKTSGGTLKARAMVRTTPDGFYLQFETAASQSAIARTKVFPYSQWLFLEIKIVFSVSQGSVVVRVNGIESDRIENITTDPNNLIPWGSLTVHLKSPGAGIMRMSDIYVCDASGSQKTYRTFLGDVSSARLYPLTLQTLVSDWGFSLNGKYRLIVALGQSNMQGAAYTPTLSFWRTTNPFLPIWHHPTGTFQPLEAGVNSMGLINQQFPPFQGRYGFEMAFAEMLAQLCENAGLSSSNIRLVKSAQDASTVLPGYDAPFTWDPGTPNSLFHRTATELNLAIASLGGIGNIERIDYFWYQGESEGLTSIGLTPYPGDYFYQTFNILISLANLFLVESKVHVIKIHRSIQEFDANNSGEGIRSRLRLIHDLLGAAQGEFLDIDHLTVGSDLVHLDERSYDNLGVQMFQTWMRYQSFGLLLADESGGPIDSRWIGSAVGGTKAQFEQASYFQHDLNHSPVLSLSTRNHLESTASGERMLIDWGSARVADRLLANTSAWTLVRDQHAGIYSPEDVTGVVTLSLA